MTRVLLLAVSGALVSACVAIVTNEHGVSDTDTTATSSSEASSSDGGHATGPGTATSASGSGDVDGSTATTAQDCDPVPLCALCPPDIFASCGLFCAAEGFSCRNTIGDGATCSAGVWECSVHPPLGTECNEVCSMAEACTEIGCSSQVTVELSPSRRSFTPGYYALHWETLDTLGDCDFTISASPRECATVPCVAASTCSAIYELARMPPRISLELPFTSVLRFTVVHDNEPVVTYESPVPFTVVQPNGPGCEPACGVATVPLIVP